MIDIGLKLESFNFKLNFKLLSSYFEISLTKFYPNVFHLTFKIEFKKSSLNDMLIDFRERGRERRRQKQGCEKH